MLSLIVLPLVFFSGYGKAADSCLTDTSQSDFLQGTATSVDLPGSGVVVLQSGATVDQQNTNITINGFTFHSYWWFGQVFTAGISGPLTAVDVRLFCNACVDPMPDIQVSIRAVTTSAPIVPTGSDLAVGTIPGFANAGGGFMKATFATPPNMVAGTKYAILVHSVTKPTVGEYAYLVSADDTAYAGGYRINSTNNALSFEVRDRDIGFRVYSGSGYATAGNLASSSKDSNPPGGSSADWSTLSWTGSAPANTALKFQAAGSDSPSGPFNFIGPDGTAGSFFTSSGASLNQFDGKRYLKYKALLSTSNTAATPTVNDVTACYSTTSTSAANLGITKTDGVSTATPGGSVTYTIVASNAGPSAVTSATVVDNYPTGLTCNWTCSGAGGGSCPASGSGNINSSVNLPANATATFTASCTIAVNATGSISNTATISSTIADPDTSNNSATDTDTLAASANLGITKTDGISTATPGGSVTYTIVASNAGPSAVTGANVIDNYPTGLSCNWTCSGAGGGSCPASGSGNINSSVNLPVNATVSFIASCNIASNATGSIANTASISSTVADPATSNNSATDTDTLTGSANLGITKTDNVGTVTPGGSTTYTIIASNSGPTNVTGATVSDNYPSGLSCTWTCGGAGGGSCPASGSGNINSSVNLPAGGTATFTVACNISSGATGSIINTATISSAVNDPIPGNNSATDTDSLSPTADLGVTISDGVGFVPPGGSVTYHIVANNSGANMANGSTVSSNFPSGMSCTWTCSKSAGASCSASGTGNINDTANLPVNGNVHYTANCSISPNANGSLAVTASVTSALMDPVPANNSANDVNMLQADTIFVSSFD